MDAKQIVVLGGGFAGLWAAIGAARKLDELGVGPDAVEVTLVDREPYHNIRVRNYEADLTPVCIPFDQVLGPLGIRRVEGAVSSIDPPGQRVVVETSDGPQTLSYDRLVYALGSQLVRPDLPGIAEFAFDVDTYRGAARLGEHLQSLAKQAERLQRFTAVVVGAGLTGIEVACELPGKLREVIARAGSNNAPRVILADHNPLVGSDMGPSARPVIETALAELGVETRLGVRVAAVDGGGIILQDGERIAAATVVWCAGMRANPLARQFNIECDRLGRLPVDRFMRVQALEHVFAAGDGAWAMMDAEHASVMSCQHSRPMGRYAGHNVVCDLLGLPMLPLQIDWYVTVLDLGPWGAVYTQGWDRSVVLTGAAAKDVKRTINCQRIYPPLTGNRAEILAAAAPVVQRPPDLPAVK